MEPVRRECQVCGISYDSDPVRLRHGRQTTCGRVCSYKLRAAAKTNRAKFLCSTCGKEFERPPSHVKSKHEGVYCSRQCHYRGRGAGLTRRVVAIPYVLVSDYDRSAASTQAWATRRKLGKDRHGETTRERLREATIRYVSRLADRRHVSKLEDEVAEALTALGYVFARQVPVRDPGSGRFVGVSDFMIEGVGALEVQGSFWHADPRLFPGGPIHHSQRRTVARDARKRAAYLALGVPLTEVWELDLRKGLIDALRRALPAPLAA